MSSKEITTLLSRSKARLSARDYRGLLSSLTFIQRILEESTYEAKNEDEKNSFSKFCNDFRVFYLKLVLQSMSRSFLPDNFDSLDTYQVYIEQSRTAKEYSDYAAIIPGMIALFCENFEFREKAEDHPELQIGPYIYQSHILSFLDQDGRIVVTLTRKEDLLFRMLYAAKGVPINDTTISDNTYSWKPLAQTIKEFKRRLEPISNTVQILTEFGSGYYLEILETTHTSRSRA